MKFLACYLSLDRTKSYWRTIWADTLNEATGISRYYARNGYRCVKLIQDI